MNNDDKKLKDQIVFDAHPKLSEEFSIKTLDNIFIKKDLIAFNNDGTLGLFAFLTSIGLATFIESTHGIQAAKILIYNATWFEFLLLFLGLNLI